MSEESENITGNVLIYLNEIERFKPLLKKLEIDNINILVEDFSNCMSNLDRSILDTLNEYSPDFVLIENKSS